MKLEKGVNVCANKDCITQLSRRQQADSEIYCSDQCEYDERTRVSELLDDPDEE